MKRLLNFNLTLLKNACFEPERVRPKNAPQSSFLPFKAACKLDLVTQPSNRNKIQNQGLVIGIPCIQHVMILGGDEELIPLIP